MDCHSLLQGIFSSQGSNLSLLGLRQVLCQAGSLPPVPPVASCCFPWPSGRFHMPWNPVKTEERHRVSHRTQSRNAVGPQEGTRTGFGPLGSLHSWFRFPTRELKGDRLHPASHPHDVVLASRGFVPVFPSLYVSGRWEGILRSSPSPQHWTILIVNLSVTPDKAIWLNKNVRSGSWGSSSLCQPRRPGISVFGGTVLRRS